MLGRCFALAFLLFFSGKSFAGNDNYTRAADTFKAIEKLYGVEDVPLFRETYPFDNHLKVSYLSNQEQAEQETIFLSVAFFGEPVGRYGSSGSKTEVRFPKGID